MFLQLPDREGHVSGRPKAALGLGGLPTQLASAVASGPIKQEPS